MKINISIEATPSEVLELMSGGTLSEDVQKQLSKATGDAVNSMSGQANFNPFQMFYDYSKHFRDHFKGDKGEK